MSLFPAIDPIPLPAPVWMFKALHILTLALHFTAVQMLLGGTLVAVWLNLRGKISSSPLHLNAASTLSRRLPIVMTYVINLGVPPLLFTQVLYGRALYTSSILIGVYWLSVIFLLMASYWLLYQFAARAETGRTAWPLGLLSWLLAASIAKIYTTNMTLMLRPEVWNQMYSASGVGAHLPPYDPALLPRWGFMLAGGLTMAGLWMLYLAGRKNLTPEVRRFLSANGGRLISVMICVEVWVAWHVFQAQPETVRQGLTSNPVYQIAACVGLGIAALIFLIGLWAAILKPAGQAQAWIAATCGLVGMLAWTLFRDGIRDLTLAGKGLDVWQRRVETNWSVVGLFLFLFVAGLVAMGWLIWVTRTSKPVSEKVA
jgi:hypothetical protein